MRRRNRKSWGILAAVILIISGCSRETIAVSLNEEENMTEERAEQESAEQESAEQERAEQEQTEQEQADETFVLEVPPVLCMQDALSSTYQKFEISSGDYTWFCRTGRKDEMKSSVACGSGPLDDIKGKKKLKLPKYNKMDAVAYVVSWAEMPDNMVVKEFMASDMGNSDAEALSNTPYDEIFAIDLKPDRIYEITAEWMEEKLDERGFYGTASYVAATE